MSTHIRTADLDEKQQEWGGIKSVFESSKVVPGSGFTFGTIRYDAPHHSGRHEDHEALYVLNGSGVARLSEDRITISAGSFLHIPAGVDHGIEEILASPLECVLIHFS